MVTQTGSRYILGKQKWSITRGEFKVYLRRYLESDPTTAFIESYAAKYVQNGFPVKQTAPLVSAICRWGGNQRQIASRVLKNDPKVVRGHLKKAYAKLVNAEPRAAIDAVRSIFNLGLSYGSKHLKFLCPDRAVVLDKFLREALGYPNTSNGFVSFLADCRAIQDDLNARALPAGNSVGKWRVSDIEMAIFAKVRGL